jgi:5'(3')-deoxyribonucleotidase
MSKIALDHDSTLAATGIVAFDLIGDEAAGYTYKDIESWSWGLDKFGTARFLSAMWHTWTLRPLEVPLMDNTVVDTVKQLWDEHDVHIVTANPDHLGIKDGKQRWITHHEIPCDDDHFYQVPPDTTKAKLDYDVFIDDKPYLAERVNEINSDARVFVRDQRYNRDAPGDYTRINKLSEVLEYL